MAAVISWTTILYGAALTFVLVAVTQRLIARRGPATVTCAAAASAAGVIAWNAILHKNGAHGFFIDAPITVFHRTPTARGSRTSAVNSRESKASARAT